MTKKIYLELLVVTCILIALLFAGCGDSEDADEGDSSGDGLPVTYNFDDGTLPATFATSGNGWVVAGGGPYCLRSLGNATKEACIAIAGITGAGEMTFKISTYDDWPGGGTQDAVNTSFYIDGVDYSAGLSLDPEEPWHTESISIDAGAHVFKWCADHNDAFLDDIYLPGFTASQASLCVPISDVLAAGSAYGNGIASATIDNSSDFSDPNHYYFKYRNTDSSVRIEFDYTIDSGVPQTGNGQYIFNAYTYDGVTVNGTLSYAITYSSATSYSNVFNGTLTFSGNVDFDIGYDYTYSSDNGTVTYSGTQTIGDCTFTYNGDGSLTGN